MNDATTTTATTATPANRNSLNYYITRSLTHENEALQTWKDSIGANDPLYAFAWGGAVLATAAKISLMNQMIMVIDEMGETEEAITKITTYLRRTIWGNSRFPSRSSSPTYNLAEQEKAAAAAWAAEKFFDIHP